MNPLAHLILADGMWRRLGLLPQTRGHMLLGSIAPDAYHVVPGLDYRRLHFRSRRETGERLQDFLYDFLEPAVTRGPADEQAFWMGWLSHISADMLWRRLIRAELPDLWGACLAGDPAGARHLRHEYRKACDAADRRLAEVHPQYVAELRWLLRGSEPTYMTYLLTRASLSHWVGMVTTGAMPPSDPGPLVNEVITFAFLTRAFEAGQEEALALINSELRRAESLDGDLGALRGN